MVSAVRTFTKEPFYGALQCTDNIHMRRSLTCKKTTLQIRSGGSARLAKLATCKVTCWQNIKAGTQTQVFWFLTSMPFNIQRSTKSEAIVSSSHTKKILIFNVSKVEG